MIEVSYNSGQIVINGHANYALLGKDIVCAAVSTLVQTLIESVEKLTDDKIEYDMQPGKVEIKFWTLSEKSKTLMESFFIGIEEVSKAYTDYVRILEER